MEEHESNEVVLYREETISPIFYFMKMVFFYATFQKSKANELKSEYAKTAYQNMLVDDTDYEKEKEKKRLSKLNDSKQRIDKLKLLQDIAKNTIYEKQLEEILNVTLEIHEKFANDTQLSVYTLEQFHSYHTDPFIKLIDTAFTDIKDIKIIIPIKAGSNEYVIEETSVIDDADFITSDLFDIVDKNVFDRAQSILFSMKDSWKISLPKFNSVKDLNNTLEKYAKTPELKRIIKSTNEYIFIGNISEIYVILLHKSGSQMIQYNILTNFPRIIKLK